MFAIMDGNPDQVVAALDQGADPAAFSDVESTPLDFAVTEASSMVAPDGDERESRLEVVRILLDRGASATELRGGSTLSYVTMGADTAELTILLINRGADVHTVPDGLPYTSLYWALEHARDSAEWRDVAARLIRGGVDREAWYPPDGRQPIHVASVSEFSDIVRLLIERGDDPDARTECGLSALHFAASADVARILLKAGADPSVVIGPDYGAYSGLTPVELFDYQCKSERIAARRKHTSPRAWSDERCSPELRAVLAGEAQ